MISERIFLAVADRLYRTGLRIELEQVGEYLVVGETRNAKDTLSGLVEAEPDLVIIDASLPGTQPEKLAGKILERCPQVKILVLTTFNDDDVIARLSAAGAHAMVMRSAQSSMILRIVRALLSGVQLPEQLSSSTGKYPVQFLS